MLLLKRPAWVACFIFFAGLMLLPTGTFNVLIHPDQYVFQTLPDGMIPPGSVAFTAAHLTTSVQGSESQQIELVDLQTRKQIPLMRRPYVRHCNFDLTPYLNRTDSFVLQSRAVPTVRSAKILAEEFLVQRCETLPFFPPLASIVFGAFLVYLVGWLLGRRPMSDAHIMILITLIGFSLRWNALGAAFSFPLEGDAIGYSQSAATFSWANPLATGLREPLYIWVLAATRLLAGPNELYVRLVTTLLSTGIVWLTCALIVTLTKNRLAMIVGGFLVALGNFAVFNAARGERSELFVFLLLFYFYALLRAPNNWKSEVLLAGLGTLVSLTWLIGGITVVLAYLYRWKQSLSWRQALLFFALLLLLTAPHWVIEWINTGDPFHALNAHVNFYKNARETGVPSYNGPNTNWASYLFMGGHLGSWLRSVVMGYIDLFLNPTSPANHAFLGFHPSQPGSYGIFPLLLVGILMDFYRRRALALWLTFATVNITVSFLAEIRDPRLFLQVVPWFAYFVGRGVQEVAGVVRNRIPSLGGKKAAVR